MIAVRLFAAVCLFQTLIASAQITVPGVLVGDPNNPADPNTTYGSVGYDYELGTYDTTINQYTAFLNAVAKTDTYGLWDIQMSQSPETRGIARSGVSGSYTYSAMGDGNRPITYVSWFDAARFVNWLQNGQPTGPQSALTTENGAYALNGATSGVGFTRSANAQYWIPSENEWYKGAYYQPTANGGPTSGYWLFPTRSNTQPNSRDGSTTDPNSANYYYNDGLNRGYNGGYAVNDSTSSPTGSALTPVGAFTLASSYYGTFDQGGDVEQWDDFVSGSGRAIVGGDFGELAGAMEALEGLNVSPPSTIGGNVGFRIAMAAPEPGPVAVFVLGAGLVWLRRKGNHE
jgi:sulfatase modifying factor 1